MLTFICYPKCTTCHKAKALLDSYHAQYETRDIKADKPGYDELKKWLEVSELSVRRLFNTSGQLYRSLGLKDKLPSMSEDECLKLLATDGMLVRRPLLVDEYRTLVGFNKAEWESVFTEYNRKKLDKVFNDQLSERSTTLVSEESDKLNAKLAAPIDVDEYIEAQPSLHKDTLRSVRQMIRMALPDATEKISWQMPTYWQGKNLIHFAAQKNHIGIYPGAEAVVHFKPRLTKYKTSKGGIQLPYKDFGSEQLNLITEIAVWCGGRI